VIKHRLNAGSGKRGQSMYAIDPGDKYISVRWGVVKLQEPGPRANRMPVQARFAGGTGFYTQL
jgi:hypothetical protein